MLDCKFIEMSKLIINEIIFISNSDATNSLHYPKKFYRKILEPFLEENLLLLSEA